MALSVAQFLTEPLIGYELLPVQFFIFRSYRFPIDTIGTIGTISTIGLSEFNHAAVVNLSGVSRSGSLLMLLDITYGEP